MNLLLDTHALLWWLADAPELTQAARDAISDPERLVFVSSVTIWEIVIKKSLGKLHISEELQEVLSEQPFERLDVTHEQAFAVARLPMIHRDPFDRLLVAQCLVEGLTLVTHDTVIAKYDVGTLLT